MMEILFQTLLNENIFFLFEYVIDIELLQFLVSIINEKLFKTILLENLESIYV